MRCSKICNRTGVRECSRCFVEVSRIYSRG